MLLSVVFMVVMSMIYVRKKLNETEAKIESMFDLCETLTHEVKQLKMGLSSMSEQQETMNMSYGGNNSDNKEVSIDYQVNEINNDEYYNTENESEDEDESEDESEDERDNEQDGIDIDEYNKDTTPIKDVEEDEEDEEDEENDEGAQLNVFDFNDPDLTIEQQPVKVIDITEVNVESELNNVDVDTDYSKMTVKELKQLIVEKGYTTDVTKLKRSGLINILRGEN